MGKSEIPVGESNGLRHSIWEDSENMGCDLRWCYFCAHQAKSDCMADVDVCYSDSLSCNVACNCLMFRPEISNWMIFSNGNTPDKVKGNFKI